MSDTREIFKEKLAHFFTRGDYIFVFVTCLMLLCLLIYATNNPEVVDKWLFEDDHSLVETRPGEDPRHEEGGMIQVGY